MIERLTPEKPEPSSTDAPGMVELAESEMEWQNRAKINEIVEAVNEQGRLIAGITTIMELQKDLFTSMSANIELLSRRLPCNET